jgi:thiol-disulfide isomerase/thioredoxin
MKIALQMVTVFVALTAVHLSAEETFTWAPMESSFVRTNGDWVQFGKNGPLVKTNSPLNTEEFKEFMWREHQLRGLANAGTSNTIDKFVVGSWLLAREYPHRQNGYQNLMLALQLYEFRKENDRARNLANELIASSTPEHFKLWSKGFLNRINSLDKPITLKFTALDGRKIDMAKMRGKVVLVDFWATDCGPCVQELPAVKAAYDRFHNQGFEVIGISCDTDKNRLERFLKENKFPWPQYFDGKQQGDNRFTLAFGIDGIPDLFLVDKKGHLRFDDLAASSLNEKVSQLLAE